MKKKLYIIMVAIVLLSLNMLIPREAEGEIIETDVPEVSGIVENLPWAKDKNFLKAQKKNGTDVLMTAFCTVLTEPAPNEEFNVNLAANSLKGTVVEPNEIFSQNSTIGPYDEEKGYMPGQSYRGSEIIKTVGGGVCKIASTLYNVSVASNLEIIERHNHFMPVSYVPLGQDATVSYGSKDIKIKNNTDFPILIWTQCVENRIYIGFYGREVPPKVEWSHKQLDRIKAPKNYKVNKDLAEGEERVIVSGMDGASVESWVTITTSDGKTETKHMGISRYWPMPHLIEINN